MRGLTLTQPWATLVAIGAKQIETRGWVTDYRGPIAIHAGQGLNPVGGVSGLRELIADEPFRSVLRQWDAYMGTKMHADPGYYMPRGSIVAVADLVGCCPLGAIYARDTEDEPESLRTGYFSGGGVFRTVTDQEHAFGDYGPGRYGWLLAGVRRLVTPIPYRGALGLWRVPDEVQARIMEEAL
jgi:hypothetical protein